MIRRLLAAPVFRIILIWHVFWGVIALCTQAVGFIEVLNGLLLATACGVTVAYLPIMLRALFDPTPTKGLLLSAGIWLAWESVVEGRIWSITWGLLGSPLWFRNTDFTTHFISITLLAGLFHMGGPEAIEGRVPTKQWIRLGIIVAIGALIAFLIMLLGVEHQVRPLPSPA